MSDMSSIVGLNLIEPKLISVIGDCPNVEIPTMGGQIFWTDERVCDGWRLQLNSVTGLARIVDRRNIRRAWGNLDVMREKFKRLTRKDFLEPGDIVGIARKRALNIYEHYAVYIGDGKVIHYSSPNGDFGGKIKVRMDNLRDFLGTDKDYFVLFFNEKNAVPHKIQLRTSFNMSDIGNYSTVDLRTKKGYCLYSPKETVARALSRMGEDKYNLIFNNCEHFAVWCKTGVAKSYQVERRLF